MKAKSQIEFALLTSSLLIFKSKKEMASCHTRSNSLPSRSHPLALEVDEQLSRLRSSQAASTSSIGCEINGLQDLQDCADKMLQLPLIQQALAQGQNKKSVDELLNGSLRILDICSIAQNALLQTKESTQELQSVLRRRRGDETGLTSEIKKYLVSRKAVRKAMHKALGNSKGTSSPISQEHVSKLKEVEAVTLTTLESLLSLVSGLRTQSKLSGLSLVSKLMRPKKVACEQDETEMNEFEKMDATLSVLISHKTIKSDSIIHVQNQLKELESTSQDLEESLELLSRRLIKVRVSLLNILNS